MRRDQRPVLSLALICIALALGAAGCGSRVKPSNASPDASTRPPTTSTPSPTGTGSPSTGSAVQLNQVDFAFNPREITVTSGDSVEVRNSSARTPHTFTIEGKGIDVTNNAGESEKVKIDLKPGTYTFICRFHATGGMMGTLIVK